MRRTNSSTMIDKNIKKYFVTSILIVTLLFVGCSNTSNTEQNIKMGDYNGDGTVSETEKMSFCYEAERKGKKYIKEDGEKYNPKEDFGNYEYCYFFNTINELNNNLSMIKENGTFKDCLNLPKEFIPHTTDESIKYYQAECYEYFAIKNEDYSLCSKVDRNSNMDKDLCLIEYSKQYNNPEICSLIEVESLKPVCEDYFN